MAEHKFQATEGLLNDVMRKQAGTVEKAILEAVMNSVDANATGVNIVIEEDVIVIEDDGDGMRRGDVQEYFEKFGLKDTDIEDKEFGKFRMGRGQIFNFGKNTWHSLDNIMVIDLDNQQTGVHRDLLGDLDEDDIEGYEEDQVILYSHHHPSYHLLEASSEYNGCRITVELYQNLDSVSETVDEVCNLIKYIPWFHTVTVRVNGEDIWFNADPQYETDLAYYIIDLDDGWRSKTHIYNLGAFVMSDNLTRTSGEIITKRDMDVNLARNDILDTDEEWENIKDEYIRFTLEYLQEKEELKLSEQKWVLEMLAEDMSLYSHTEGMKVVRDINGEELTLKEAATGDAVSFAPAGDKLAEDAMNRTNTVVLDSTFEESYTKLQSAIASAIMGDESEDPQVDQTDTIKIEELVEQKLRFEMEEVDYSELSSRRQSNFDRAEWFLKQVGFDGEVRAGFSKHADAWRTSDGTLYIHRGFLNQSKMKFLTEGLIHILEVASHDGDTRRGLDFDSYSVRRNLSIYVRKMAEPQLKLIQGEEP